MNECIYVLFFRYKSSMFEKLGNLFSFLMYICLVIDYGIHYTNKL